MEPKSLTPILHTVPCSADFATGRVGLLQLLRERRGAAPAASVPVGPGEVQRTMALVVDWSVTFARPLNLFQEMDSLLRGLPDWAVTLIFLAGYFVVMRWVLPRLGVPT